MPKARWLHVALECVGVVALIYGMGQIGLYLFAKQFEDFAGGRCTDTPVQLSQQPSGEHQIKGLYRECGSGNFAGYFLYLSTGNPNKGYEWEPILELNKVSPDTVSAQWDSTNQISVNFPASAEVVDAYAKTFGVQIVLRPTPAK